MFIDLLERIDRYLRRVATLQDLETWLLANLQKILTSGDVQATTLANQLDADLIDLREGLLDTEAFRARLARQLQEAGTAGAVTVTVSPSSFLMSMTAGAPLRTRAATRFLYALPLVQSPRIQIQQPSGAPAGA